MSLNVVKTRELSAKQTRAIVVLLNEPRLNKAAKEAGVSARTLLRWLNLPDFADAYRSARNQLLQSTLAKLQACSADAVETLQNVLSDPTAKPGERVSAARAILEFSLKAKETLETEERLAALESRLATQETRGRKWG